MSLKLILVTFVSVLHAMKSDADVCTTAILINDVSKRGTRCISTDLSEMVCDRQLIEGWYYAEYNGQMLSMPTTCPSMFSCGTAGGIWLNGVQPAVANETITVQGCVRGLPSDDDECCAYKIPIKVKHCGEFYAYYLTYTVTCSHAFCFGNHACPLTSSTSHSTAIQQTTTTFATGYSDPCSISNSIDQIWNRGTECNGLSLPSMICDRQMVQGWYRGNYNGENLSMPTKCPPVFGCGTAGPIWLNETENYINTGTHPSISDGIVESIGCRRGFASDVNSCCVNTVSIQVKNCGQYFVYQLPYTRTCSEAYCFGSNSCLTPSTTQIPTTGQGNHSCSQHPGGKISTTITVRTSTSFLVDQESQEPNIERNENEETNAVIIAICILLPTMSILVFVYIFIKNWKGVRINIYKKQINEKSSMNSDFGFFCRNMQQISYSGKPNPPTGTFLASSANNDVTVPVY